MKKLTILAGLLCLPVMWLSAGGAQGATAQDPVEISWFGLYGAEIMDGNEIQTHLEGKFGVTLVNKQIDYKDREKINLMIASGEHTDYTYAFVNMVDHYIKGAFRSIPGELIREHAPGYSAWLDASGPMAWKLGLVPGTEDEYMGLVRSLDYKVGAKWMPFFRLDYLEQAGVDLPPLIPVGERLLDGHGFWSKSGFTIDEYENIMQLFRDNDYDGNGAIDTIPLGTQATVSSVRGLYLVMTLHGLNFVDNYNDNGETVKLAIHSRFKDTLQTAQRWFNEGYLDNELPAVSRATWEDKILSGVYGSFAFAPDSMGLSGDPSRDKDIPQAIVARNPDAKILMMEPFIANDGKQYSDSSIAAFSIDSNGISAVRFDVSDEKLATILQIYDYVNFDDVGMIYTQYGTAGVNFEWSGQPDNSYPTAIEGARGSGGKWGFGYYNANTRPNKLYQRYQIPIHTKPIFDHIQYGPGADWAVPQYRQDVLNETDYLTVLSRVRGAVDTVREEFAWEAITTKMDIEAEWDAYVSSWLGAGGQLLLNELEKMPQTLPLREGRIVY